MKLLGVAVIAGLAVAGDAATADRFEVASIRECAANAPGRSGGAPPRFSPGRLTLDCNTPSELIRQAYVLFASGHFDFASVPIKGGPAWLDSARYTITAEAEGNPGAEMMMGPMLQKLLEDRFRLKIHRDTIQVPVYELSVAKRGLKLPRVEEGTCVPISLDKDLAPRSPGQPRAKLCGTGGFSIKPPNATMKMDAMTLDDFSTKLAVAMGRPVINKTGINGMFDFRLEFSPDETTPGMPAHRSGADTASDLTAPSIFTALQEQLGLKLDQAKGPGESLVIDEIETPSEN
jgi:uncharacterized protein (TIGR03435 family)